jgi:hypothetical protein
MAKSCFPEVSMQKPSAMYIVLLFEARWTKTAFTLKTALGGINE